MKILAINGSPRLKGNTACLIDEALKAASSLGIETEKINLGKTQISPCLACKNCAELSECVLKDDGDRLLKKLCGADGIILATPVYFYNVSAQMKALIDRCHFLYSHDMKPTARTLGFIVVAGEYGVEDTLHALHRYNEVTFNTPPKAIFSVAGIALEAGEVKNDSALIEKARKLGRQMAGILMNS
jgi:multimeric flavodoxin WrbA